MQSRSMFVMPGIEDRDPAPQLSLRNVGCDLPHRRALHPAPRVELIPARAHWLARSAPATAITFSVVATFGVTEIGRLFYRLSLGCQPATTRRVTKNVISGTRNAHTSVAH